MGTAEAAASMRRTAKKLRAWAKALPASMRAEDAASFYRVLVREAERLEREADELAPADEQRAAE
jgi:hypothetical protein